MGVTGLWRLIEPAGSPVHLDTLRGKVLAVDISIWLHQMVKGFQDAKGAAVANSHLLGLFQRLCKLLYYGIRPIFVFDGCFPVLKRQTIINRQNKKAESRNNAEKVQRQLMEVIAKHIAVKNSLTPSKSSQETSPTKKVPVANEEDLFKLPSIEEEPSEAAQESSEEEEAKESITSKYQVDLHSFDVKSDYFKKLSSREKHDLLTELKETRKASSWGRLHELPTHSDDFSDYQMKRLLKRRQVQVTLEETEKEIGGHFLSINELEILMNEEGIDTKIDSISTRQIASNENTHYVLVKNLKTAMNEAIQKEAARNLEQNEDVPSTSKANDEEQKNLGDEYDEDLETAIKLSLQTSNDENESKKDSSYIIDLQDTSESDEDYFSDEKKSSKLNALKNSEMTLAKAYMKEYSGLSEYEIERILSSEISSDKKLTKGKNIKKNTIVENGETATKSGDLNLENVREINKSPFITENEKSSVVSDIIVIDDEKSKSNSDVLSHNPRNVESMENMEKINDNVHSDPEEDIKFDTNFDATSTSSEDSFEEVPEIENDKSDISKEDIFADVFVDESKFQVLQKNILSHIAEKANALSGEKKTESPQVEVNSQENVVERNINLPEQKQDDVVNNPVVLNTSDSEEMVEDETMETDPISPSEKQKESEEREIVKDKPNVQPLIVNQEMRELATNLEKHLEKQQDILEKEQNKLDRMGRNITDEMTKDVQELLRLFGVPYIVAPMEAEAQCAFLESINLTDGTITDDSDIWLFGGRTVYRNFFNQQKNVLRFLSENISRSFKLQREDLILLALLVGSDYTTGVTGVGPVTALEILAAFPRNKSSATPPYSPLIQGLANFRDWCSNRRNFTHTSLRSKLKNISLSEEFPSIRVIEAYLCPEVETSKEAFSWGTPDAPALRDFTKEKFGWSREKTDEILNPVLKRLNIKNTQQSIKAFFDTEFRVDTAIEKMSKRVQKAVENLCIEKVVSVDDNSPSINEESKESNKEPIKRKRAPKAGGNGIKKTKCEKLPKNDKNKTSVDKESDFLFDVLKKNKETIPQREKDQNILLKNKLKAIEVFRTSKKGPSFVNKRKKVIIQPKDEAELSESSNSE